MASLSYYSTVFRRCQRFFQGRDYFSEYRSTGPQGRISSAPAKYAKNVMRIKRRVSDIFRQKTGERTRPPAKWIIS
jgi:hypothetical protein